MCFVFFLFIIIYKQTRIIFIHNKKYSPFDFVVVGLLIEGKHSHYISRLSCYCAVQWLSVCCPLISVHSESEIKLDPVCFVLAGSKINSAASKVLSLNVQLNVNRLFNSTEIDLKHIFFWFH